MAGPRSALPARSSAADRSQESRKKPKNRSYETDVLIYDVEDDDSKIPLVIIECKITAVSTHDLLTYGAKAESHRTIFPYLRYGMVIGEFAPKGASIQYKMLIHGRSFDFITVMMKKDEQSQIRNFKDVLKNEIKTARMLRETHQNEGFSDKFHLLHRRLDMRSFNG